MPDLATDSLVDVRASRTKRILFATILVGGLVAAGIVALKLVLDEPGAKACEHLAELRKTDRLADKVIERLVRHVESRVVEQNLVQGAKRTEVRGSTPDEQCHDAIDKLDKVMGHGPFTRMVDCITSAKTARAAALCF